MTEAKTIGARGAALALAATGLLTLLLSFERWGSCPTTPCGGILMAISDYSGLDLGFGVVTAVAGLTLAAIGLDGFRRKGVSRFATAAALLALLIVAAAGASVIWMYVLPGDDKEFYWPPFTAVLVGIVGLIAFAASLRLRRTMPRRHRHTEESG
jgi:peptidoglycan/LPS O-acetylase OafA/YrhL